MVKDSGQDGMQDGIQGGIPGGTQGEIRGAVELVYRPTRADILTGVLVRERLRRLHVLRWGFTVVVGGAALLAIAAQGTVTVLTALVALCAVLIWATPHLQAGQVRRTVDWQGEFRASVSGSGITTGTTHMTLQHRWSAFRGYRETRDHMVLLGQDPNILLVAVLPKRGLGSPDDAERLLDVVSRHLTRV
ncbi:YcxB family protein [Streptomyces sp. NPDC056169]|uniref:YcxB family protein n=1 Tax=Streptomyces sp. NPDC056169 TaxID=3345734 RepID=UPI0035E0BFB4